MTQTLEESPAQLRPLERRAPAHRGGIAGREDRGSGTTGSRTGSGGAAPGVVKPTAHPTGAPVGRTARRGRPIGVLVIDDSLVFRTGMCRAVQAHEGLELVGEADCGEAGLQAIADLEPDVVVLDLRMPDLSGISVLHRLRAQDPPPACRVLVISATLEGGVGDEVLAAGADGCLSKALSRAEICAAVLRLGHNQGD